MNDRLNEVDDAAADAAADAFVERNSYDLKPAAPGAWQGLSAKPLLNQSARAGRSIMMAGAVVPIVADKVRDGLDELEDGFNFIRSRGFVTPGNTGANTGAQEWYFENVVERGNSAVDFWTPPVESVGTAANVVNTVSTVLGAFPQILGGPGGQSMFLASSFDPATDLVNQGVDAETALKVGATNLAVNATGIKIPAAFGAGRATRMATGAGANLALGVGLDVVSGSTLKAAGYDEAAAMYSPTDPTARLLDTLMGAAFGIPGSKMPRLRRSEIDAVLTANNADHYQRETMPGEPTTPGAALQHQDNLQASIQAILDGIPPPPVNVEGFRLRPELQPAPRSWVPKDDTAAAIKAGADELGIDAVELATVISFETGGTFDPDQRGPTTRWGQHRGLIQFGEPQRAKYGVRDGMTVAEQMGAVVAYLRDTGVRPGMGILDVYSAINAGGVGRYNASDTAAGGTPGTVRDKVNHQMRAHREKSLAMFDGEAEARPAYTADAAPRLEGEDDKAFAKRVIDRLPEPDVFRMVDDPSLYFNVEGSELVSVSRLASSKSAAENEQGGGTGIKRMAAAAEGLLSKRAPIEGLRNGDGTITITDGNDTLTSARAAGFDKLPVNVVGEQSVREQMKTEAVARHKLTPESSEALALHYEAAALVKPRFDAGVRAVSDKIGAEYAPIMPEHLKGLGRAAEKVAKKYKGDVSKLDDVVRATIVVDRPGDVAATVAAIREQFGDSVLGVVDRLDPAAAAKDGTEYRDVKVDLVMDGHRIELQINTPEMLAAKTGEGHRLYEAQRVVAERAIAEDRDLTSAENAQIDDLVEQARVLYTGATAANAARKPGSSVGVALEKSAALYRRGGSVSQARVSQAPGGLVSGMPSSTANSVPVGNVAGTGMVEPPDAPIGRTAILSDRAFPLQGAVTTVVTERGLRVQVRYAVVEAGTLIASHDDALNPNPAFPAELQPRDRARAASAQQVTRIANNLNPELLAESPKAADGAPIVGPDLVVESGNARTIAVRRAYATGKADVYRGFLTAEAARFGLDPAAVAGVREPVLVRVALEEGRDRAEFARQSNEQTVAGMSATEQALSDSRNLPDMASLVANDDGTINMRASGRFVHGFIEKAVGPNERATMATATGDLSQQGQTRIRAAVFARAYGDADLVAMMAEATDANVKNLLAGMLRAAPEVARLREMIAEGGRYGPDLIPDLVMAGRKFAQLRSEGTTVEQFEAQGDFFGEGGLTPKARDLLRVIGENARAPKRMAEYLQRYVAAVDALGDPRQADLMSGNKDAGGAIDAASKATRAANDAPTMRQGGDMFGVGRRPAEPAAPVVTPENRAAYEAIAAHPDLIIADEDGNVRPAAEFLAQGEADMVQTAETLRTIDAAANCFTRVA